MNVGYMVFLEEKEEIMFIGMFYFDSLGDLIFFMMYFINIF